MKGLGFRVFQLFLWEVVSGLPEWSRPLGVRRSELWLSDL